MKRCYLVTGPESAGNRMLGQILAAAGCYGDHETPQHAELPMNESPAFLVRSFKHRNGTWDLDKTLASLIGRGYRMTVLITVRHPVALVGSQKKRHLATSKAQVASETLQSMYRTLEACSFNMVETWFVPYESLTDGHEQLCRFLGLTPGRPLVENRNGPHYV